MTKQIETRLLSAKFPRQLRATDYNHNRKSATVALHVCRAYRTLGLHLQLSAEIRKIISVSARKEGLIVVAVAFAVPFINRESETLLLDVV